MLSFFHSSWVILAANWGPLLEMIWQGSPTLRHTLFRMSSDVSSAVTVLLHGERMIALLKRSTVTKRESYPFDCGRSVMKSMVMVCQTFAGMLFGCRGTTIFGRVFVVWHNAHPSTNSFTKVDIPGHQYSLIRSS